LDEETVVASRRDDAAWSEGAFEVGWVVGVREQRPNGDPNFDEYGEEFEDVNVELIGVIFRFPKVLCVAACKSVTEIRHMWFR
jgi:hypothetical protein